MTDISNLQEIDYVANPVVDKTRSQASFWNPAILNRTKEVVNANKAVVFDEVTKLDAADAVLGGRITTNTTNITTNTTNITTNAADISTESGRNDGQDSTIATHETRIDSLEGLVFAETAYPYAGEPTADNDTIDTAGIGAEFSVGALWLDTTTNALHVCEDSTATAAVWNLVMYGSLTGEPTGFASLTEAEVTYDAGTRTVSVDALSPATEFSYYINGRRYTHTTTQSVVIPDTEGIQFVYFTTAGLVSSLSEELVFTNAYVASLYWDVTNQLFIYTGEERHGVVMDAETHRHNHTTRGTRYVSGLSASIATGGNLDQSSPADLDAQIQMTGGVIRDEDLQITIATTADPAAMPVFYKDGASGAWRRQVASTFPVINAVAGSLRLAWNELTGGAWQQTEATNGDFVLAHIFVSNDPIQAIVAIQGESEYSNLNNARAGATNELNNLITAGLPFEEFIPIATYIYQTANTYSNTPKARLRSTDGSTDHVDWREVGLSPTTSPSNHENLSNLQGGAVGEYYHVDATEYTSLQQTIENKTLRMDPQGFVDRTLSTLSWNNGTRELTISPTATDFEILIKGDKYVKTAETIAIPNTTGQHFVYYDAVGVLTTDMVSTSQELIRDYVYLANIYWSATDASAPVVGDERHGIAMDWNTHFYLHHTVGSAYDIGFLLSNFAGSRNGTLDTHAQFAVEDGDFHDEDIEHEVVNGSPQTLSTVAELPVLYRWGATGEWRTKIADTFPIIYDGTAGYTAGSGRVPWNEFTGATWQLTEVGNNDFVLVHYYATNDILTPIIGIQGQATYATVALARAGATTELGTLTGIPFIEFAPLGTCIFKTNGTYTNTPNCYISTTDTGEDYVDWRQVKLGAGGGAQDLTQYLYLGGRTGGQQISGGVGDGDLVVTGDLTVQGTTTTIDTTNLVVTDNQIVINDGEVGAGVSAGTAGLRVDRGSLTDYDIIFDETSDSFKIGEVGSEQKVATREDTPTNGNIPVWDSTAIRFDTDLTPSGAPTAGTATEVVLASAIKDEDNMASDSATAIPTQQSTKAYVDTEIAAVLGKQYIYTQDATTRTITSGTQITISTSGASSGLTLTSSKVTLTAGKPYFCIADLRISGDTGTARVDWALRDFTAASNLSSGREFTVSHTIDSSSQSLQYIWVPGVDSDVGLYCTTASGTAANVQIDRVKLTIIEIG